MELGKLSIPFFFQDPPLVAAKLHFCQHLVEKGETQILFQKLELISSEIEKMGVDREDGRTPTMLKPLSCSRNVLNRAHGSASWSQGTILLSLILCYLILFYYCCVLD